MAVYYEHDLIKIANLSRILENDPYYSSLENRYRVFFVDSSIPTITSPFEMLHTWEAHGLEPIDNNNIDVLATRKYRIRNIQTFLERHSLPLPGALFPDSDNNTSCVHFRPLAAKYFATEHQRYVEQQRHRNDLLNKFFFNSEIVHREDYYQFETTPISQPGKSNQIRVDALKEIQSVWLELKRNNFSDELKILQEWIEEYVSNKAYFDKWKIIKELSDINTRIDEYESIIPGSITEVDTRDRKLADLRERRLQLQTRDDVTNEVGSTAQDSKPSQETVSLTFSSQDHMAPSPTGGTLVAEGQKAQRNSSIELRPELELSPKGSQKTPAELLAMHEMDPSTWSQLAIGKAFYDGNGDRNNDNTLRGWAKKQLRKARRERPENRRE